MQTNDTPTTLPEGSERLLADSIPRQHAEEMERALIVLSTVLLRKAGRKSIRITQQDLQEATEAGLATVETSEDGKAITYKLPSKRKGAN